MSIKGIFRKNGNIKRLNDTVEVCNCDPASVDLTSDVPVQLAGAAPAFLAQAPRSAAHVQVTQAAHPQLERAKYVLQPLTCI